MAKNIDKEYFILICNSSESMSKACTTLELHWNTFVKYAKEYDCYRPNQSGKGMHKKSNGSDIPLNEILDGLHPEYQTYKLKNKLLKAGIKENKCDCCGITEWNGKPLNMELHHIDGNPHNHRLENLSIVCPNCHAQTINYRALNIN